MIGYILEVAKQAFPPTSTALLTPIEHVSYDSDVDELLHTGSFFPHFPYHSQLRQADINRNANDSEACTKSYKSGGKLGAGVLLFWCIIHRECLGFVILEQGESCKAVYDVLSTRFPVMPRFVIYDNACNLYEVVCFLIIVRSQSEPESLC